MNRGILAVSAAVLLSVVGIVTVSNVVSAETVSSVCSSSGPGSGSWVINANDDVPPGVVISSVVINQRGAIVTEGIGTRQVQVQYVGDVLSGTVTFSNGEIDSFSAEGDCTFGPPTTPPPPPGQCPNGHVLLLDGSPPVTLATVAGPGTVTVTGQTSDSHPGHATQGQTGEQIGVFAVPIGGGPEIVIIAETEDVSESSDNPPPVLFSDSESLGAASYTIVLRHVGGGPLNSVCVSADVSFQPPSTTTTTTSTTTTVPGSTTTTTLPTTTTTTLPDTFTFGAATTVCIAEVPTIRIVFQNQFPSLAGQTGTLTMSDVNGNVVSTQSLVYTPGATVDLLYPGTSVNPDGSIDDVPGWILTDDGFWVRDPSDEFLREGINLSYTVNPTATAFITYPPESSACANPDGPFPPGGSPPPGRLPATL